jgi:spore coat polysaccharide biosynthesis protein SpsF (cytidylyltransferase family)
MRHEIGNTDDVLERMLKYGRAFGDYIVRVTGDNPFTCPQLLLALTALAEATDADYVAPADHPAIPRGVRSEVIKVAALDKIIEELGGYTGDDVSGRVRENVDHSVIVDLGYHTDACFTIDTMEQLEYVRGVMAELGPNPSIAELVDYHDRRGGPDDST